MKKMFLALIVISFISCDIKEQEPGIATIVNESSNFDVEYIFAHLPKETKIIKKNSTYSLERPLSAYIKSYEPSKRVSLKVNYPHENDGLYTFSERNSYAVIVINSTGQSVVLSADGWMDDINLSSNIIEQTNPSWLIYTNKPNFSAIPANGFPADVVYNFDEGVFKVIVRWGN